MQAVHGASRSTRRSRVDRLIGAAVCALSIALLVDCGTAFETIGPNALDAGAPDASDTDVGEGKADATNIILPPPGLEAGTPSCDTTQEPNAAACLVNSAFGVFVSASTGLDAAVGDKAHPLKTITEGIAKAAQTGIPRVYVCNGTYAERVSLDGQHDGISLYGGFDCGNNWSWAATVQAQVQGPEALYALRIDATTKAIEVEDIAFTVPDASGQDGAGAGNSSIAAFVSGESAGVTFRRVGFHAGAGTDGHGGATPATNLYSPDASDLQGNAALGISGGQAKNCACKQAGSSQGGAGGGGGDPAVDGGTGSSTPLAPALLPARNGLGGAGFNDQSGICLSGRGGADGASQLDGGTGAPRSGSVSSSGWAPTAGLNGLAGNAGQGGGGGGGGQTLGSGGGGCGGCGGAGGLAGQGGGASVGLLVQGASVQLQGSRFATGVAGKGGSGSTGEVGGAGGNGAGAGAVAGGCGGGAGGSGAGGQGGGGGAGGVSLGILADVASQTTIDEQTMFTLGNQGSGGAPGSGGAGGTLGTAHAPQGAPGTKGVDGVAQASLSL
jgi:hypothetical protein